MNSSSLSDGKGKRQAIRICAQCSKEIDPGEDLDYVETRRKTKMYFHRNCLRGKRSNE